MAIFKAQTVSLPAKCESTPDELVNKFQLVDALYNCAAYSYPDDNNIKNEILTCIGLKIDKITYFAS